MKSAITLGTHLVTIRSVRQTCAPHALRSAVCKPYIHCSIPLCKGPQLGQSKLSHPHLIKRNALRDSLEPHQTVDCLQQFFIGLQQQNKHLSKLAVLHGMKHPACRCAVAHFCFG